MTFTPLHSAWFKNKRVVKNIAGPSSLMTPIPNVILLQEVLITLGPHLPEFCIIAKLRYLLQKPIIFD